MTTLSDQLVIRQYEVDHVASRADMLHQTVLSARVGMSGTDRHAVHVVVWAATPEREHSLAGKPGMPDRISAKPARVSGGNVYCGSQRGRSGVHSYSLTEPVTCERCLARAHVFSVESMPTDVITTDKRGNLVPVEA